MVLGPEPGAARDLLCRAVHRALEPGRRVDVFDRPALDADEVVVVAGEILGQLVAGELVVGDDPTDGPGLFEHDQVPIHRALRQLGLRVEDLVDREGPGRRPERLDDGEAVARRPLAGPGDPVADLGHQRVGRAIGSSRAATGDHRATVPAPRRGRVRSLHEERVGLTPEDATARFAELLAQPEPAVSPGEAALLIAAHAHHGLDVDTWLGRFDDLAASAPSEPAELAHHLFVVEGFAGNRVDYADPRNSYLDDVLTRRLGIPITLSVVMMEVGRRVGVVVEGIGMPRHFLVATHGGSGPRYFDPFDNGAELSVEGCAARFAELAPGVAFDRHFLDPVGPRAIVTRMLANLEQTLLAREPSAVVWVTRLRLLVPDLPPTVRRHLAARLGSLGAFSAAAEVLDELASEPGSTDDEAAARALRARAN